MDKFVGQHIQDLVTHVLRPTSLQQYHQTTMHKALDLVKIIMLLALHVAARACWSIRSIASQTHVGHMEQNNFKL